QLDFHLHTSRRNAAVRYGGRLEARLEDADHVRPVRLADRPGRRHVHALGHRGRLAALEATARGRDGFGRPGPAGGAALPVRSPRLLGGTTPQDSASSATSSTTESSFFSIRLTDAHPPTEPASQPVAWGGLSQIPAKIRSFPTSQRTRDSRPKPGAPS